MEKKDVEVVVTGERVSALVDPLQIDQVVTNLVVNAIHACRQGDTIRVVTGSEVERGAEGQEAPIAVVRVEDTGPGMTPEVAERAFDPFFTTKDVGEGTGLGLSVAHGIVRDHGGSISLDTTPGRGTTFTVRLPVSGAAAEAGREAA